MQKKVQYHISTSLYTFQHLHHPLISVHTRLPISEKPAPPAQPAPQLSQLPPPDLSAVITDIREGPV